MTYNTRYDFIAALARGDPIPAFPKNCPKSKGVGWSRGLRRNRKLAAATEPEYARRVYPIRDLPTRETELEANQRWPVNPTLKMTKKLWTYRNASKLSAHASRTQ
jgi:hypothetical protein